MKYGRISVFAKVHIPIYQILKKMTVLEILYTGICSSQEGSFTMAVSNSCLSP